jgi:hypothetical protein
LLTTIEPHPETVLMGAVVSRETIDA